MHGLQRQFRLIPAPASSRPLGICLISEEYPPEMMGGIATYTQDLARGLAAMGHRVHVITRTWENETTQSTGNLHIHKLYLPEPSWRWGTWNLNLRYPETRYIFEWAHRVRGEVRRIIEQEAIDVVECPEFHAQGLLVSLLETQVPVVVKLHTPAYLCRKLNGQGAGGSFTDTRLSETIERFLTRRANRITAPSQSMANAVARDWRLDPAGIEVIPNPVDDESFCPGDSDEYVPSNVLFVGRIERRKGVEVLIDSIPRVLSACPWARFQFIGADHPSAPGGGSMVQYLKNRLRDAGINVRAVEFGGVRDRQQLPALYRAAALCVVPSFYESFGYTCTEPMSAGRAVIASDVGALREIVTDQHDGRLVPSGDSKALGNAIIELLDNEIARRRLGNEARRTIQRRFGVRAVSAQTAAVYSGVVHR